MKHGPVKDRIMIFQVEGDGPEILEGLNAVIDHFTRQSVSWRVEVMAFQGFQYQDAVVPGSFP